MAYISLREEDLPGIGSVEGQNLTTRLREHDRSFDALAAGTFAPTAVTTAALAAGETVLLTPASDAGVINLTASGVAFLCSLAAGTGRKTLVNTSAYTITLGHEEGASYGGAVATNCFNCPDAIPYVLRPGARVDVVYGTYNSAAAARWNVIGVNSFAPGGRLCPATIEEFVERTAFAPTNLWPCDDMGPPPAAGSVLREATNETLAVSSTPLVDFRQGGYRGVRVTEGGKGWKSDVSDPEELSIVIGAFYGHGALASDNVVAGRVDTTAAARRAYVGTVQATGKPGAYFVGAAGAVVALSPNKVVTDSVVRLVQAQLDKDTDLARCRVSGRGETAVQSADGDAAAITTISGGATPVNFVGATGLTGSTAETFVGGVFQIYGAGAEGTKVLAKIAHRLGME